MLTPEEINAEQERAKAKARPRLADYGLTGLDSRPKIDIYSSPVTEEERAEALEAMILYQVETRRVVAFRNHLKDYEWELFEQERRS